LTAGILSRTPWAQVGSPKIANTSGVCGDDESFVCHNF
jgi:hypothetical protein